MSQNNHHETLVKSLQQLKAWPHHVNQIEIVETHISTVILTGEYAYKIKKPVDFGFLNFTRLADRKHFCEEEIRLNSRLAPSIYFDTVAITGSAEKPEIDGEGEAIEYAVKMRQFDQTGLLDKLLAEGKVNETMIDMLADQIADFHENIPAASAESPLGQPEKIHFPMQQNFDQLRPLIQNPDQQAQLERLEKWTNKQFKQLERTLTERKEKGFIRECHGDMHLGNITQIDHDIAIFDGIEFNDDFRWIDVMSELAFITMDLTDRGASHFAQRLLNHYLEITGDYAGLKLLRFYQVYRAMVRAKVASLRLSQPGLSDDERQQILRQYQSYADLAEQFTRTEKPALYLMYGLSGSGKSTVSGRLLESLGAIRIRSDKERKRLFGENKGNKDELNAGIYNPEATEKTYQHLLSLAETIIAAGFPVIVDATFLQRAQRQPFQNLAEQLGVPFQILNLTASLESLVQRVIKRNKQAGNISDATENVIMQQQTLAEPPGKDEPHTTVDTDGNIDYQQLGNKLKVNS
ncbi:MAG TPA: hypothetical protein EYH06_05565 [Chromatiales bacterium]|nr:hypothetical protein [Thiotrichales bacterium]HIP68046.1 hypothetical protein [Chromatiales bacterium]